MAKDKEVTLEVVVAGKSVRGDQLALNLENGAIEVDRNSHPDLDRVQAGTRVKVIIADSDKAGLEAGNVVPGVFQEVVIAPVETATRSSDSRNS